MCLAIPGKIVSVAGDDPFTRTARVSFDGVIKEVSLAYLPDARVDEYVVVHAGFALSRVDEAEAREVFEYLAAIGVEGGEGPEEPR
ncbi:MAG TPA: HypC/HybG/HupF family hydrogenase formation chaperone [Vicinamibacterales bacterium]|nr:HypC/HybG/HupF family hydrogenase formation chaperone [Vicinamibacterales bacterium]